MITKEDGVMTRGRQVWTDHTGVVHECEYSGTLCGLNAGVSNQVLPVRACSACVEESLRRFALDHDCTTSGCLRTDAH